MMPEACPQADGSLTEPYAVCRKPARVGNLAIGGEAGQTPKAIFILSHASFILSTDVVSANLT
ncbi:MAG: hypothetical protein OD814_000392 [Candidatus Alkanophagales archaeon MCA70_species_1]|nr:hypothetical protein [Candidatus Alkanophaga volatiphilum]